VIKERKHEMSLTAYATTSTNQVGADAGISVEEIEDGQPVEIDRLTVELSLDAEDSHFGLDEDAADRILEGMGFSRTGQWRLSGGQYAATVASIA
jgi:hypothetical protein